MLGSVVGEEDDRGGHGRIAFWGKIRGFGGIGNRG